MDSPTLEGTTQKTRQDSPGQKYYIESMISCELKAICKDVVIGMGEIKDVRVSESDPGWQKELRERVAQFTAEWGPKGLPSDTVCAAIRRLFWQTKLDPTRYRPSSESLMRRVLAGKGIPIINKAVDINNLYSLYYRLPMGIYDRDRLEGPLLITIGKQGENFEGISRGYVHIHGGVVARDDIGIFGTPFVDSARSKVTTQTRHLLLLVYSHQDAGKAHLEEALDKTLERMLEVLEGKLFIRKVL
jgi:DNA/RNA-binding domain of Phe-tRNA-synthetase-like protein